MELLFIVFAAGLRMSLPLVFASLGGFMSERSGVINMALECFLLVGAFTAASVTSLSGNWLLGWSLAFALGTAAGLIYGLIVIKGRADQIIIGTAMNLFAIGTIPFISKIIFNSTGSTPSLPIELQTPSLPWILLVLVICLVTFLYRKTAFGLWLHSAGENPEALVSAGVDVSKIRLISVSAGAGIAALGGATLSMCLASNYSPQMSAGRGFIALAALIFGRWKPIPACLACLFFGVIDGLQIQLQGISLGGVKIPVQFIQIVPYAFTILALAGFLGRAQAPKALGRAQL